MRRFFTLITVLTIAGILTGCTPPAKKTEVPPKTQAENGGGQEAPPADPATIPESLKHDAFHYYGLEATQEMTYDFDYNGSVRQGTQKATFLGMKDGKAEYKIERSDALQIMGTDKIEVAEDGIYLTEVKQQPLEKAVIALPAKVEVGASWPIDQKLRDGDGNDVLSKAVQKIVGQEKVKTPAGEFDCIVVTMEGTLTVQDEKKKATPVTGKAWYAAGVGTVKLSITSTGPDGKPVSYTITLASKK
ncbi:MAG: hypothetical protein KF824_06395 [Fimbriimonadaceae bacterium]|nr:MAG: hypothetical protein KF824_06395 [Fimbriimonadaceae bacterium]